MKNNLFEKCLRTALLVGLVALPTWAAETLFSNYAMNVTGSGKNGELWVFSRSGTYSGVTLLNLNAGTSGIQVNGAKQGQVSDSMTAMQDGIYSGVLAEHRRISSGYAGKVGYVLPMYGLDDDGNHLLPAGFFSIRGTEEVLETPLAIPEALEDLDTAMHYAVSGFAFDSTNSRLWLARGVAGLGLYDVSGKGSAKQSMFQLNLKTGSLDTAKVNYKWDSKNNPRILDVKLHPETGELWMATSKGLWKRSAEGKLSQVSTALDTSARVTGLWMGGSPLTILAETSYMQKESMKGALWVLRENAKDFAKVDFLDTAGKLQKKDVYDDGDYTVSGVAFIGKTAYVAVTSGGSVSGFFRLDSTGVRAWETDDDGKNNWLYGFETGATDRDAIITSICSFPLDNKTEGLALATYGNGVSVSADSGKTWTTILNRAKLGGDLGTIRMVPSVITSGDGDQSLVSYKVSKDAKITIDVFSYDMRKIRTIVKDAPRSADKSRSTNPKEDFWDGKDKAGRPCTMGVYYVRVKDNHGHIGWGKVMTLGGHK